MLSAGASDQTRAQITRALGVEYTSSDVAGAVLSCIVHAVGDSHATTIHLVDRLWVQRCPDEVQATPFATKCLNDSMAYMLHTHFFDQPVGIIDFGSSPRSAKRAAGV